MRRVAALTWEGASRVLLEEFAELLELIERFDNGAKPLLEQKLKELRE